MKDALTDYLWPKKIGVHNLSKLRLRLIGLLLGQGTEATLANLMVSAQDIEAVRQDLFEVNRRHPVTAGERELIYRLLRIGHSYGFRYHRNPIAEFTQRNFRRHIDGEVHTIGVDFQAWPRTIRLELTSAYGVQQQETDQLAIEVDQPEAVAAKFVELCEVALQPRH